MRILVDLQSCQTASRYRGIGRYSLSLLKAMLEKPRGHEFIIVLNGAFPESVEEIRGELDGLIPQNQIRVWRQPENAISGISWRRLAAKLLRELFIHQWRPDVIHISSIFEGVSDEAVMSIDRFVCSAPVAVTHYDLIPHFYPEKYLSAERSREAFYRRIETLKKASLFLGISDYTCNELISTLHVDRSSVVDIAAGVNPVFRRMSMSNEEKNRLLMRFGVAEDFVLYAGGGDSRKNIDNLVKAYSMLERSLRDKHPLVLISKMPGAEETRLRKMANELAVGSQVHIISYVSDDDLLRLYNLCAVSVLPSFHEGFGLPLLEAMACGVPAIGSNRTSIPEVLGREHALFDPADVNSISQKISDVLNDEEFANTLSIEGLEQAKKFSWEISAGIALDAMESLYERRLAEKPAVTTAFAGNGGIAVVAPVPEDDAGRQMWRETLEVLAKQFDVAFVIKRGMDGKFLPSSVKQVSQDEFHESAMRYSHRIYQVSDESRWIADLAVKYPGYVDLRDFFLGKMFMQQDDDLPEFARELYLSHGYQPLVHLSQGKSPSELIESYPCNGSLFETARAIFVQNKTDGDLAKQWFSPEIARKLQSGRLLPSSIDAHINPSATVETIVQLLSDPEWSKRTDRLDLAFALATLKMPETPTDADITEVAGCAVENFPSIVRKRQLFLDVTELYDKRQVSVIRELIRDLASGVAGQKRSEYRFEPVYAGSDGQYFYARAFVVEALGLNDVLAFEDTPIELRRGDVFLGIGIPRERGVELQRMHDMGVCVHDIIHVRDYIKRHTAQQFECYFDETSRFIDGVVCLSEEIRSEFLNWLDNHQPARSRPLLIDCISPSENWTPKAHAKISRVIGAAFDLVIGDEWRQEWLPGRRYCLLPMLERARTEIGVFRDQKIHSTGRGGLLVASSCFRADSGDYELALVLEIGSEVQSGSVWCEVLSKGEAKVLESYWPDFKGVEGKRFKFSANISLARDHEDLQFRLWVGSDTNVAFVFMEMKRVETNFEGTC